jgi:hypothetical protein
LGRWLNRDPIEENGGIGLYGIVANAPTYRYDYIGLASGGGTAWYPLDPQTVVYKWVQDATGAISLPLTYNCQIQLFSSDGSCELNLMKQTDSYTGVECSVSPAVQNFPIPYASVDLIDMLPIPGWLKALLKTGTGGLFSGGFKGQVKATGTVTAIPGTVTLSVVGSTTADCPAGEYRLMYQVDGQAASSKLKMSVSILGYAASSSISLYSVDLPDVLQGQQLPIEGIVRSRCCPCPKRLPTIVD